ncbi:hypothetical protein BDR26DRAFT_858512 [Obelidium mucronatum]|nr:hypothetical protein BDR26DRAFT_858512 [Obelidium mucronatum]
MTTEAEQTQQRPASPQKKASSIIDFFKPLRPLPAAAAPVATAAVPSESVPASATTTTATAPQTTHPAANLKATQSSEEANKDAVVKKKPLRKTKAASRPPDITPSSTIPTPTTTLADEQPSLPSSSSFSPATTASTTSSSIVHPFFNMKARREDAMKPQTVALIGTDSEKKDVETVAATTTSAAAATVIPTTTKRKRKSKAAVDENGADGGCGQGQAGVGETDIIKPTESKRPKKSEKAGRGGRRKGVNNEKGKEQGCLDDVPQPTPQVPDSVGEEATSTSIQSTPTDVNFKTQESLPVSGSRSELPPEDSEVVPPTPPPVVPKNAPTITIATVKTTVTVVPVDGKEVAADALADRNEVIVPPLILETELNCSRSTTKPECADTPTPGTVPETTNSSVTVHPFFNLAARKEKLLAEQGTQKTPISSDHPTTSVTESVEAEPELESATNRKSRRTSRKAPVTYYPTLPALDEAIVEKGKEENLKDDFKPNATKSKKRQPNLSTIPEKQVSQEQQQQNLEERLTYKPLSDAELLAANPFFLSTEQRRLQKLLQDQNKLLHQIQERQRTSAEFSKGKSANPFLQPRLFTSSASVGSATAAERKFAWTNTTPTAAPWPKYSHTAHEAIYPTSLDISDISTPFKMKGRLIMESGDKLVQTNAAKLLTRAHLTQHQQPIVGLEAQISSLLDPISRVLGHLDFSECNNNHSSGASANMMLQKVDISIDLLKSYLVRLHGSDLMLETGGCKTLWNRLFESKNDVVVPTTDADSSGGIGWAGRESWVDKFRPSCRDDIVGIENQKQVGKVKLWLEQWRQVGRSSGGGGCGGGQLDELGSLSAFSSTAPIPETASTAKEKRFKKPSCDFDPHAKDDEASYQPDDDIEDSEDESVFSYMAEEADDDEDVFQPILSKKRRKVNNKKKKKSGQKASETSNPNVHLRLVGPPSSGRTNAVKVVAAECGFDVIEIHSGLKRGGKDILSLLSEATQSHVVTGGGGSAVPLESTTEVPKRPTANFFALKKAPPKEDAKKGGDAPIKRKRKMVVDDDSDENEDVDVVNVQPSLKSVDTISAAPVKPSLIVVEDADVLFEQDKGFWASMWSMMEVSKRPIVFICTDDPIHAENVHVPPNLLNNLESSIMCIYFTKPPIMDVFCYMHLLLLHERYWLNCDQLLMLCEENNGDLRKIITQTELQCRHSFDRTRKFEDDCIFTIHDNSQTSDVESLDFCICEGFRGDSANHVGEVLILNGLPLENDLDKIAYLASQMSQLDILSKVSANELFQMDTVSSEFLCADHAPGPFSVLVDKYSHSSTLPAFALAEESVFSEIQLLVKMCQRQVYRHLPTASPSLPSIGKFYGEIE